jgi:hypothetical protein
MTPCFLFPNPVISELDRRSPLQVTERHEAAKNPHPTAGHGEGTSAIPTLGVANEYGSSNRE